jgi:hypothetical protein
LLRKEAGICLLCHSILLSVAVTARLQVPWLQQLLDDSWCVEATVSKSNLHGYERKVLADTAYAGALEPSRWNGGEGLPVHAGLPAAAPLPGVLSLPSVLTTAGLLASAAGLAADTSKHDCVYKLPCN